jgi:predicted metal-binding protein
MGAVLHVCITCKGQEVDGDFAGCALCPLATGAPGGPACGACTVNPAGGVERTRPGRRLAEALGGAALPDGLTIREVECLSACSQGCSVALSAPGKWSYVYGRLGTGDVAEILRGAALYAASPDGIVPWRDRPQIFRKQSLARIPPMES